MSRRHAVEASSAETFQCADSSTYGRSADCAGRRAEPSGKAPGQGNGELSRHAHGHAGDEGRAYSIHALD